MRHRRAGAESQRTSGHREFKARLPVQQDPQGHRAQGDSRRRENVRASKQTHRSRHRPLRRPPLRHDGPGHARRASRQLQCMRLADLGGNFSSSLPTLRVREAGKLRPARTQRATLSRSGILIFRKRVYKGVSGFQKYLTRVWKLRRIRSLYEF